MMEQTETNTNQLISAAEVEIAKIIAKLEADTGMILRSIETPSIEVTTIGDIRPKFLKRVVLEMERLPGSQWQTEI